MPKYLFQATYTADGLKGLIKEGGSKRQQAVEKTVQGIGGTLEAFYYALGDTDVFLIVDLPDTESATALALTVGSTGAVSVNTIVLLSPAQVDEAIKKSVNYRPPGA